MEVGIQPTSFIPPDATKPSESPHYYKSGSGLIDLFAVLAFMLFIASAALAAGMFLYLQYTNNLSASKQASIKQAETEFDPSLVQQLTDLDNRMNAAQSILGAHLAPTLFFSALNASTLQTIAFGTLSLDATDPSKITLEISGVARDVNGVALQDQLFSTKGSIVVNPIFSGVDQESDGVHFKVDATVNASAINYQTLLNANNPTSATPSSSTTAPPSAPQSPFNGQATQSATPASPTPSP
ncbi:MAG TPA: hypothetical protein VMU27_03485 [Candidatus Paceibacterota bacterium]|nr:hypothetical protein [Candidatus Paceibacterota bacterium]